MIHKLKKLICRHNDEHKHCVGIDGDMQNVIIFKFCFQCARSKFEQVPTRQMKIDDLKEE